MNAATDSAHSGDAAGRQEELSFLFAQLVLQQSNMAMMFLGKVAHPESGKVMQDVEAARLFIDQLEMLEAKTKGNLSKDEETLLKQTLMTLRLNFVQAVESSAPAQPPKQETTPPSPGSPAPSSGQSTSQAGPSALEEDEHRKKFSKKY
jgi:Domain of unknown function (DUF1844)